MRLMPPLDHLLPVMLIANMPPEYIEHIAVVLPLITLVIPLNRLQMLQLIFLLPLLLPQCHFLNCNRVLRFQ